MAPPASLADLARVFARISLLGFGGPNAHIALMLDEVVERRGWLTRERFLELVAVTNLLPGPNSSEVAIHVGHVQHGVRGGLVAGLAFTLPTFGLVVALSALYFRFGSIPAVGGVVAGMAPFIVAIIVVAAWKLGRAVVTDAGTLALAALGLLVAMLASGREVFALAVGAAAGWAMYGAGRPSREATATKDLAPEASADTDRSADKAPRAPRAAWFPLSPAVPALAIGALGAGELARLLWTMLWTGSVLFGGGYMLIALVEPAVVGRFAWLTPQEFLDGIAITQSVPGPIVMLVAFVGYAVAGTVGAAVAAFGVYLPSFLAVFGVAPLLTRWRSHEAVRAALRGVNAVACGAILGAGLSLATVATVDVASVVLIAAAILAQLAYAANPIWLVLAGLVTGIVRLGLAGGAGLGG